MPPTIGRDSAASRISAEEIEKLDLTGVDLVHLTGIPPALSGTAREASLPGQESKGSRDTDYL